jgi:WD40 repeat protein
LFDGFYASGDKTFKIWNTNDECVNTITEDNMVFSLLLLPEGNIASGSTTIKIWKCVNDYKDIQCIHTLKGHTGCIYTLYLVNNDYIISGCCDDESIKIWESRMAINALTP